MAHCSIVGCKNKQANNSEVTYFSLPEDPQKRKSLLVGISRDKSNLPSNVLFVWIILKRNILINHGI